MQLTLYLSTTIYGSEFTRQNTCKIFSNCQNNSNAEKQQADLSFPILSKYFH